MIDVKMSLASVAVEVKTLDLLYLIRVYNKVLKEVYQHVGHATSLFRRGQQWQTIHILELVLFLSLV